MSSRERLELTLALHQRQLLALNTPATELLFGGASEGGKSHFLRVALITWCLGIRELQCVLIRKKFEDIQLNHLNGPSGFKALLRPLIDAKLVDVTQTHVKFQNGSLITFKHCQDERQFDSAQGVENHVLAIDEAPQISERLLMFFRGWVRMSREFAAKLPAQFQAKFPRIIYTGNPVGPSLGFFRRNFVKARAAFECEPVHGFIRQYIPSRAQDNPSVDLEAHKGRLAGLGDAALIRALDEGDWDAPVGEFYPEWDETRHVVPDFQPPSYWLHFRSFDWGTAEPHAVLWWCVSDGESFDDATGRRRWFPRGALVCYREWYGCDPERPALGLRMRNEEMATGILARSPGAHERRVTTVTDSLPFQDRGGVTIAETFAANGVLLTHGDTSRIPGWSQLRSRLIGTFVDSNDRHRTPLLYFTESCTYCRDYIPALPRHPSENKREDATEHGEATHICDAARLAAMAIIRPIDAEKPEPDPRFISDTMTFQQALDRHRVTRRRQADAGW